MKVRRILKSSLPNLSRTETWRDNSRSIYCDGEYAYVPVLDGWPYDLEIPERAPYKGPGYQRLGDTLLLHGASPTDDELNDLIAWEQPACILHLQEHAGVMRLPKAVVLYGKPHDVTFSEAGIFYTLNPAEIMFSQGNRREKMRLRSLVRSGEKVADMFAGIGYFTLTAAFKGAEVHAMEINRVSFVYLIKNIHDNYVSKNVRAQCGDCRDLLSGTYDRILMGHFDAVDFLPHALAHAGPGTILHVHGVGDRSAEVAAAVEGAGFRYSLSEHKVKKYASRTWHCVWDVELR
ncbi:SAM-dependent methyltransferase [Methanorbis furvi]|uniref:SAM-dependent methyltransferase TRM5/TYW2-type domain-containing protein n=1 Tax=Methanorbis furvi TaxID=3028299 RepID=A0AAE4MB85_9EURY|nr:hypothetical protein [Methanocorpusculaceae archaeon Ag1]